MTEATTKIGLGKKILNLVRQERLFATLFLIILSVYIVLHNLQKPRLLMVHSYETNYSWTTEQIEGINRVLGEKNPYIIRSYFLNTKQKPFEDYLKRAEREVRELIKQWKPDVIIATDDNAQIMAAQHFVNDPHIKIVFTGVQGDLAKYGYTTANNVTGITEKVPPLAIREMIDNINQALHGNYKKIFFVTHDTSHSKFVIEDMEKFDWGDYELVHAGMYKTFDEWKAAIKEANLVADILLIGGYNSIIASDTGEEKVVPYEEVLKWTKENSTLLPIGARGVYVEDGGMIAVGASPFEQGEVAAHMAINLLERKRSIKDMPIVDSKQYLVYMRKRRMEEFNSFLELPSVYEAFARASRHYFD